MDAKEFLASVPFFADVLDDTQLDLLAAEAFRAEFDDRAIIIREHDVGDSMFAIVSGTAEVSTRHAGRQTHVATVQRGDVVGEMSLLTGTPRSAKVIAIGPVVAFEIRRSALKPILVAAPELSDRFAAMLDKRRAELDRIHGDGYWNLYGLPRERIGPTIRKLLVN